MIKVLSITLKTNLVNHENNYKKDKWFINQITNKQSQDQLVNDHKEKKKEHQLISTTFTLFGGAIGASLLSISYIEARIGWVLYLLLLILTAVIACTTYYFENLITHYSQQLTYRGATEAVSNKGLSLALDIFNYINSLGIITAYISIGSNAIGDFIKYFAEDLPIDKYKFVIKIGISMVIDFPLTLLNKLTALSKIAAFGSLAILMTAISIFVYFFIGLKKQNLCGDTKYDFSAFSKGKSAGQLILYFLMYIPSMQTSVTLHNTLPQLYHELHGPKVVRKQIMQIATIITMFLSILVYALAGFAGGMTFGQDITDNIIQTYSQCKFLYTHILFIIYACVVIIAFPLILFPVKFSLMQLLKIDVKTKKGLWYSFIVSFLFCGIACLIACVLESIVQIFGLFSSLTGSILFFVVPALLYQKSEKFAKENSKYDQIEEEEKQEIDSVIVAVGAIVTGSINQDSLNRIRSVSRSFGIREIQIDTEDQSEQGQKRRRSSSIGLFRQTRTTSQGQKRSILMQQEQLQPLEEDKENEQQQTAQESIPLPQQLPQQTQEKRITRQLDELSISEEQENQNQDDKEAPEIKEQESNKIVVQISTKRKVLSYLYIAISLIVCAIGLVMNTIDVVNGFKNKE